MPFVRVLSVPIALLCGSILLRGGELPAWWQQLRRTDSVECRFAQESESAVFGKLRREGTLVLARGGRLRVAYARGTLLVADGRSLVQFDPETRTAQRIDLRAAMRDSPLLNVLVDPSRLEASFTVRAESSGGVRLVPRKTGVAGVLLEGQGRFLSRITWTDGTGAKQVMELKDPKPAKSLDARSFHFLAPAGTRWITP